MEFHTFIYASRATSSALRIDESRAFSERLADGGYCLDAPQAIPRGSTYRVDSIVTGVTFFAAPSETFRAGFIA
ncbi:hypothetical protein [Burkholderia sp. BCC1985]|uniref:hypothetical protein n=1 Tax=Burkholderia sp. BCC1985 TaxID=2817442 RepID=UPI002AB12C33|nr:hypothetical protein [Burkholderia sp. BCC1985]